MISLELTEEEKTVIYRRAAESAREYMEKEGNDLTKRIEREESEAHPEMDETRTIHFENVSVQFAHPSRVLYNSAFQEALYRELIQLKRERRKGFLQRLYE